MLEKYEKPFTIHPAELDRERAHHAILAIEALRSTSADNGELKSWIEKLPAMIQTNGLAQAMAFYKSRDPKRVKAPAQIYNIINHWLAQQFPVEGDLLSWLVSQATPQQYRHMQAEAQAYLRWLKQLAKAELKGG